MMALGLGAVVGVGALTMGGLAPEVSAATQQAAVVLVLGALGANVGEHLTGGKAGAKGLGSRDG